MHTRLHHLSELGIEEQCRPETVIFFDVSDDVPNLQQVLAADFPRHPIFEEFVNTGFADFV